MPVTYAVDDMKVTAFWDVEPCSLVEVTGRPDDGGCKYLWKGDILPREYAEQCPRNLTSWSSG
jgi:hypothetical protein